MKAAYLLAPGRAQYTGKATGKRYLFDPWTEVDPLDWPKMQARVIYKGGCCGHPVQQIRVFGSEEEMANGVVGFSR
jgi:hypothetical protein